MEYYEHVKNEGVSVEEVRETLRNVVTGTIYPLDNELGTFSVPEKMYVSYGRLLEMIEEGYNIIRVLDPNDIRDSKIYIECQECIEKKTILKK